MYGKGMLREYHIRFFYKVKFMNVCITSFHIDALQFLLQYAQNTACFIKYFRNFLTNQNNGIYRFLGSNACKKCSFTKE